MYCKRLLSVLAMVTLTWGGHVQADAWKKESGNPKNKAHKHEAQRGGPPPWAPAHGYRANQEARSYSEEPEVYARRRREFGIDAGTCNRETLGTVLGGVVGGVVGSRVGDRDDRTMTTIAGVVVGALIGREIGRRMDRADQACTGQVLERAADHETIRWRNADTGMQYLVTPEQTFERQGRFCRTYTTVAVRNGGERSSLQETACRTQEGAWQAQ